jgi:hypothetical protein
MNAPAKIRFWFSVWGGPWYASGWCFGATPEEALDDAIRDVKRWRPEVKHGHVTLQSDERPYDDDRPPATYHDFPKVVFAHGPTS